MNKLIRYFIRHSTLPVILILLIIPLKYSSAQQINIGFISAAEDHPETDSAFAFLSAQKDFSVKRINAEELNASLLKTIDILWYHKSDTLDLSEAVVKNLLKNISDFYNSGGKILLTMDACRYLDELGLEESPPQVRYENAMDEGYGRKLGLHAFRDHPVFNNMHGGAYIWNSHTDNISRQIGYFDDQIPLGKTVAVDWAYITLRENSKLVLEYEKVKGRVIAAGSYIYFSEPNYNRLHLETFITNCIYYLAGRLDHHPRFYWSYQQVTVSPFQYSTDKINYAQPEIWTAYDQQNVLRSLYASGNFWNVTGERIFISGKEKGGIDEIWIHPFMSLRDYEVGIRFSYKDSIIWLNDQRPAIEVRPGSFHREYKFRRAFLKEIITADVNNPAGVIHYEYRGVYPAKLIIKFKSNLRYMWPYSENVLREINYSWNDSLNAFIVKDRCGDFVSIIGSSLVPEYKEIGHYDNFSLKDSLFSGNASDDLIVSGIFILDLKMNSNADVIIAGTDEGINRGITYYRNAASAPADLFTRQLKYYQSFFENKLSITTPDSVFNEGYKWALIGTDKFFVNTPGIGRSLVAGYSTTERGWDGNQKVNGRPGYAWYFGRDAQWSAMAVNGYGDFKKVKDVLKLFNSYQDLTGKIYHELTTSGVVHYDASDATPLYIVLAGHYLKSSGDTLFIKDTWNNIRKAIDYCYSTDSDGDHLIEITNVGHGWVEGGKLYGVQTEVYLAGCWAAALESASLMASAIGLKEEAKKYSDEYIIVRKIINEDFWNEATGSIYFGKFKDGTYNPEKTVLPAVPLYFRLFDKEKGEKAADLYAGHEFTADWGVRILSEESPLFNPRGYHYGSVWPLFTGWASLAEYKYGNYLQGFSHVMNNLKVYQNFSKGYVEEVLNGAEYKPSGVCPHQCWSETMVLQPIIEGMLGLQTLSHMKRVVIAPSIPFNWDLMEVKNIRMADNNISFRMDRKDQVYSYKFVNKGEGVTLIFEPSFPPGTEIESVSLNGLRMSYEMYQRRQSLLLTMSYWLESNLEVIIKCKEGISALPFISSPREDDSSSGIRILSAEPVGWNEGYKRGKKKEFNIYEVTVQGVAGTNDDIHFYSPQQLYTSENDLLESTGENLYKLNTYFEPGEGKYVIKKIRIKTHPDE